MEFQAGLTGDVGPARGHHAVMVTVGAAVAAPAYGFFQAGEGLGLGRVEIIGSSQVKRGLRQAGAGPRRDFLAVEVGWGVAAPDPAVFEGGMVDTAENRLGFARGIAAPEPNQA